MFHRLKAAFEEQGLAQFGTPSLASNMITIFDVQSDVVTGASAFGGLLLVYVGGVATDLQGFAPEAASLVRRSHITRAASAALGIAVSVLAVVAAVFGKETETAWLSWLSVACLTLVAIDVGWIAYRAVMDMMR